MSAVEAAREWIREDPDPATRAELETLLAAVEAGDGGAADELADAFAGTLQFGTAGLRGKLGPGPNRMNRVVVGRAAAGLAAHLVETGNKGRPVVIGYDARTNSDVFARDTAEIMAGAGFAPRLLPRPLPTPVLAFAVRELGAAAGIMVTASHNPPQDNGYKVYLSDGCQIVPPADAQIAAHIRAVGALADVPRADPGPALGEGLVSAYVDRAVEVLSPTTPRDLRVVYTAMHGVGGPIMVDVLSRGGFAEPVLVTEQFEADPLFPTVAFPNPEEPGAMDLALAAAEAAGADLVIANDPDADRCAVAIPTDAGFRMLTGDETGWVLAWWMLERSRRAGATVLGTTACSIVSSTLLGKLAASSGLDHRETLTGFKWIARASEDLVFGYEEALGYCVDPTSVRDKDGITAALRILECAAALKAEGSGIADVLDELARSFGVHQTSQVSVRVSDLAIIGRIMDRLRAAAPQSLGGLAVQRVDDLALGSAGLPPTDGLRFTLGGSGQIQHARVIIRPSGTEPKVKAYVEVVAEVGQFSPAGRNLPAGGTQPELADARAAAQAAAGSVEASIRELFAS